MTDSEFHSWMIETNPDKQPIGPIADYDEAAEVFETYVGRRSKHPVKLIQFTCDSELPKRFPLGTLSAIEGAVRGGYGELETLRELDLDGLEINHRPSSSPSP